MVVNVREASEKSENAATINQYVVGNLKITLRLTCSVSLSSLN